ncbi:GNAT family N-acetyltransferase [Bacillus infantis]|uniref:GNAT family N-acetyltransferase n=1 Tax=Bacillus infantis TaxID=324767 RepID=UPI003CF6B400
MINEINIRTYENKDKDQVLDLLNRNFQIQEHMKLNRDSEWWEWKYERNIFGKPIIYVAERNDKIIGVRPFWPWQLSNGGQVLTCYQPIDSVVDKEYRGIGLFTMLTKNALVENKEKMDLVFNFPNEQSIRGNLKLGWTFVNKLNWYVKVNKFYTFYKLIKNYNGFESCSLQAEDLISEDKIKKIDYSIDAGNIFRTIKSEEFLKWRFLEHPKIKYGLNIINRNGKEFIYIFALNKNSYGRELIILDYFGDLGIFEHFLKEVDHISKKYLATYTLIIKKYNLSNNLFFKHFYIPQKKKNFVVLPINQEYDYLSKQYDNWEICLGMHDSV